jgi:hypothetical protein
MGKNSVICDFTTVDSNRGTPSTIISTCIPATVDYQHFLPLTIRRDHGQLQNLGLKIEKHQLGGLLRVVTLPQHRAKKKTCPSQHFPKTVVFLNESGKMRPRRSWAPCYRRRGRTVHRALIGSLHQNIEREDPGHPRPTFICFLATSLDGRTGQTPP